LVKPPFVKWLKALSHRQGRAQRPFGIVLERNRGAEDCHDAIADDLVYHPPAYVNRLNQLFHEII
jgi:hypothetical protein